MLGIVLLGCDAADPDAEAYMRGTLEGRSWRTTAMHYMERDSIHSIVGVHENPDKVCPKTDPCSFLSLDRWSFLTQERYPFREIFLGTYQQDVVDISGYAGKPVEWSVRDETQSGTIRCFTTGGPLYRDLRFAKRHALPDTITFRDLRVCYDTASTG